MAYVLNNFAHVVEYEVVLETKCIRSCSAMERLDYKQVVGIAKMQFVKL